MNSLKRVSLQMLRLPTFGLATAWLAVIASPCRGELPSVKELIRRTEAACAVQEKEVEGSAAWALQSLAEAKAYTGDFAGAVRTAQSITGLWQGFAYIQCWVIHFEQTGALAELPPDAFSETNDLEKVSKIQARIDMAKALIKAGRTAQAMKHLPQGKDQETRENALFLQGFYVFLVEYHRNRGDSREAAASLRRGWEVFQNSGVRISRFDWFETVAKLWLKLGDRAQASSVKDETVRQLREYTRRSEPHQLMSVEWARIAALHAYFGDDELAREAFRESLRVAEAAYRKERDDGIGRGMKDYYIANYADNLGQVAAYQFRAGRKSAAANALDQSISLFSQIRDIGQRNYRLSKVLDYLADEGDFEGAVKSLQAMTSAYYQMGGYCRCAKNLVAAGRTLEGLRYLAMAEALANKERESNDFKGPLEEFAEIKAKAGDLAAARAVLAKGLAISRATQVKDLHQGIARCQVRLGLLDDAYETIREIPQPNFRVWPLSELACEAAKREALRKKKAEAK